MGQGTIHLSEFGREMLRKYLRRFKKRWKKI